MILLKNRQGALWVFALRLRREKFALPRENFSVPTGKSKSDTLQSCR